jgi:two-component system, NarL family, nitrate/nitrite response regulator NarL
MNSAPRTLQATLPRSPNSRAVSSARTHADHGLIRVLLADDHPVVLKGFNACLARVETIKVVGEAANGQEALRLAFELMPDVVLMDVDMPQMNGLTATELLSKQLPGVRVLIVSMHGESDLIMRVLQCGAQGFVLKQAPTEDLIKAIETVHGGGVYFSPDVARTALNRFVRGESNGTGTFPISNREREVLIAIANGLSNKEIASRLGVGVRTVETHRERIMRKLGIHTIAGLTRFALQKGLLPL